jgi:hypothetical protein
VGLFYVWIGKTDTGLLLWWKVGIRAIEPSRARRIAMKLIDWLRRLGILRFGAEAGVYRNAKDRPMSFQMDGVFSSEKDVIDLSKKSEPDMPPVADKSKQ